MRWKMLVSAFGCLRRFDRTRAFHLIRVSYVEPDEA